MMEWTEITELPTGAPAGTRMVRALVEGGGAIVAALTVTPTQLVGQHTYSVDVCWENDLVREGHKDPCAECDAAVGEVCAESCGYRGRWPTYAEIQGAVNELAPARPGLPPLMFALQVIQGVPEVAPASHAKLSLFQLQVQAIPQGGAHGGH